MVFTQNFRNMLSRTSSSSVLKPQFTFTRLQSTLTSPRLFVSGLSRLTTNEKLNETFAAFGKVVKAKIVEDRSSGRSKGFAYVTFSSIEEAEKAREGMNAKFLDGWCIFVDPVRPPKNKPTPDEEKTHGFAVNKTVGWCGK